MPFGGLCIDILVSASTAKFYFSLTRIFFEKIKHLYMTNTTLVLNYLAPVSLCHNYSFLCYLFFTHPEASIGVLEKRLFEFLEHPPISISKK